MSLAVGDHLVIKRGDQIIGPENEAYHEFEVMDYPNLQHPVANDPDQRPFYLLPRGTRVMK